ncbi:MAG: phosphate ABC transporter permease PstA [Candidatus Humimicrobiaceae bacterium]
MRNRYRKQKIWYGILLSMTAIVIAFVFGIVAYLIIKGGSTLSWEFIFTHPDTGMRSGGIFPAILGTLYLVLGTIIFSLPIGVLAAIYLNEYAKKNRLTRMIRLSIVNVAGVPSIVFGLFGLGFFVILLNFGKSLLAGSLTLALLILPVVITSSEEALKAVPNEFREASLALGATKWQTIIKVVLPQALPGIITGSVISVGRAAGETAPILFTVAVYSMRGLPNSIFSEAMVLPYHLYVIATQIPNAPVDMQWGTALMLMILVLIFAAIGSGIRSWSRMKRIK